MARRSMDSILRDEPSVHALPDAPADEKQAETQPETPTSESEKPAPADKAEAKPEAKTAAKPAAAPDDDGDSDEGAVPDNLDGLKRALAAARGDKRKARKQWQETEKQLAELRGRMAAYDQIRQQPPTQTQAQAQQPKPTDLSDEAFWSQGPKAIREYVEAKLAAQRDEQVKSHLDRSERAARRRHQDFDEAFARFQAQLKTAPHLWQQMLTEDDPAEFVYTTGKALAEFGGVSSLDEYKKKIEAEAIARYEAEHQQQTQAPARPAIPRSLASARGSGAGTTREWSGPRPLSEILK